MPPKQQDEYEIIMLPLEKPRVDHPKAFPRMPRMYLELLENKEKIKPELVNTEHIPTKSVEHYEDDQRRRDEMSRARDYNDRDNHRDLDYRENYDSLDYREDYRRDYDSYDGDRYRADYYRDAYDDYDRRRDDDYRKDRKDRKDDYDSRDDYRKDDYDSRDDYRKDDYDSRDDYRKEYDSRDDYRKDRKDRDDDYRKEYSTPNKDDVDVDSNVSASKYEKKEGDEIKEERKPTTHSSSPRSLLDKSPSIRKERDTEKDDKRTTTDRKERNNSSESDNLSIRMEELLGDDDYRKDRQERGDHRDYRDRRDDKYSRRREYSYRGRSRHVTNYERYDDLQRDAARHREKAAPPTLAELQAQGEYDGGKQELRDVTRTVMKEEDVEDRKRELMFKFESLKKSYPSAVGTIPEYTIHSDLKEMEKSYDATVRRLSIDSNVDSYKKWLLGGFMLTEFIFGKFLGFDMQGFTQQQIVSMSSYDRLLLELGEKSYVPSGSKWPVEIRLLFLVVINAGFFIVSKMIMNSTGANLINMMNNMNTANKSDAPKPKRRMRGPSVNVSDLPDADEVPTTMPPK